ncbi:MAG: hypothetical protein V1799_07645 [bacterium]
MANEHVCTKADVNWDKAPKVDEENIQWYGVCRICGRQVYECYVPEAQLFDAVTSEEVWVEIEV